MSLCDARSLLNVHFPTGPIHCMVRSVLGLTHTIGVLTGRATNDASCMALKFIFDAAGVGQISRVTDEDIQSLVIELAVGNEQEVPDNYIACPADPRKTLGIKLPFLVMSVKNMNKCVIMLGF